MHGEYKVPGGKLVVAEIEVENGRLARPAITGDFFLEPPEALSDINAALDGLPADASSQRIAAAVSEGLREGAEMIGFSAQAVAIAVRRALGLARTWRDFEWQIIPPLAETPAMHLALDDVLSREVAAGRRPPTLRFWDWDQAAIIIGAFQSLKNEVDMDEATAMGVEVVRRATGGGAMFVEPGTAITYSLYAPPELVGETSFADSYAFLDAWALKALNDMGVDAHYKPLNDIASTKGKIGGAAQKRYAGGTVLHHVTMSYDMDGEKMMRLLRIGREKLSDKGVTSAAKRVDPVRSQTGLERAEVIRRMIDTFRDLNGGALAQISAEEREAAETLAAEKFGTTEWLHHLP